VKRVAGYILLVIAFVVNIPLQVGISIYGLVYAIRAFLGGDCGWREKMNCPGCQAGKGNMFWGECRVGKCSDEKGIEHCGLCSSLPCDILQEAFDNPEHGDNGERLANLKAWARGEDSYVKLGTFGPRAKG